MHGEQRERGLSVLLGVQYGLKAEVCCMYFLVFFNSTIKTNVGLHFTLSSS
jgi:hypothetical protein